jgi:Ion channel
MPVLGALVVLVVLQDVFTTVLHPGSGRGLVRKPLARATWAVFGAVARATGGRRRRSLLSYAGPAQIALTMGAWLLLLLAGWALVYRPALGRSVLAASGPTDLSWATALYYSGFTLTTLGTGDVTAVSATYRLLTIAEAASGFITISMVITYFLSVYSHLPSRNAFGQALHQRSRNTGDAAVIVASLVVWGGAAADGFFSSTADALRQIDQSHRSYPVLRHFHHREPEYTLPRILLVVLDTITLARTVLDPRDNGRIIHSPALADARDAAEALLAELAPHVRRRADECDRAGWGARVAAAAQCVATTGGRTRCDLEAATHDYAAARAGWNPRLRALADAMLQEWDEPAVGRTGHTP